MALWSRIGNVFRGARLTREIDEELEAHIAEAVEQGRDPDEARRAFGSALRHRENSRDVRIATWLDSLRADAVFGWRQLRKNRVASTVAVLSLALALGACAAAFRLIDALLLRPLPVAHPERLYALYHDTLGADGTPRRIHTYEYPVIREMRAAVKDAAELIAISNARPTGIAYASSAELENADVQHVSGGMFDTFGLRPAAGRLLHAIDDVTPGGHPYAVLSYDYWTRRFNRDPGAIGRTFRMGSIALTIVGVCEERFTGTQPGTMPGIFIPTMMNAPAIQSTSGWLRVFVWINSGAAPEPVLDRLRVPFRAVRGEFARGFRGAHRQQIERYLSEMLQMEPAAGGASNLQSDYREPLLALGVLVVLVLLVACANVANLMMAQAAARAREMALRVSIGAGAWRVAQLVMVEGAITAALASIGGAVFAAWAAPFVAGRIRVYGTPIRLPLETDWRAIGFSLALALAVTLLFALAPALRAATIAPAAVLKGGAPHSRRRLMRGLVAIQAMFCFLVLFTGGLFLNSYDRLAKQPIGFSPERLLLVDAIADRPQSPELWDQAARALRALPGVESVALSEFPLLRGDASVGTIAVPGAGPHQDRAYFLKVSPGWLGAMKIPLRAGRDLTAADSYPGAAIVNEAFAKLYFQGADPIGRTFERTENNLRLQVVGIAADARYRDLRGRMMPVAYVAFPTGSRTATFIVRTSGSSPLTLAQAARHEILRSRPEFRVTDIRTQEDLAALHTMRERLLAMLSLFFAAVALLLAAIGFYGVLDYSVLQRRREIGIRMAVGAGAADIAGRVTADVFAMVLAGTAAGLGLGFSATRYVEKLLFEVRATDPAVVALPLAILLIAGLLAAIPAMIRAIRVDPVRTLRVE